MGPLSQLHSALLSNAEEESAPPKANGQRKDDKEMKKGLAEWFSSKFTLYGQSFDYSTP